ncbi:MAG: tRNA (guanosine(37)-N1)-methyltransferase TrmD [Acidimicrobiales bacterium]
MRFDVITIFPEALVSPLSAGLLGKAIESRLVQVVLHDLRDWAKGGHRKVDDAPFGGGPGMVMKPEPLVEAVEEVRGPGGRVVLLGAAWRRFTQALAAELALAPQLVLICGRYEGVDDRVHALVGAEEVSIGDFVLIGGEVAALAVIEAVARLVSGVVGNASSLEEESYASGLLEYPQYTRPAEYRGLKVPEVLASGDHARVARWRREQALLRTLRLRPDLIESAPLSEEERATLRLCRPLPP